MMSTTYETLLQEFVPRPISSGRAYQRTLKPIDGLIRQAKRSRFTDDDAGLEAFIADPDDCAIIGLQAKYFDEGFSTPQWRQINQSVEKVLRSNAADGLLQEHVVATTRIFTETQRKQWRARCAAWRNLAQSLGYSTLSKFTHWDALV